MPFEGMSDRLVRCGYDVSFSMELQPRVETTAPDETLSENSDDVFYVILSS